MIVKLVALLSFLGSFPPHSAAVRLRCPENITAVPGDAVTLQYRLDPPTNLSAVTVDVKRSQDVVHVYRSRGDDPGPQSDRYRTRTTLDHTDLMRGVLKLQISSVDLTDSGPYKGFVPKLRAGCTTELIVEVRDQQNRTRGADPSTAGPAVTESDDPDAAKTNAVLKTVLPVVVCVCLFLLAVALLVLVKLGKIQICKRKEPRGTKEEEEDMKPSEGDGDAAEKGLIQFVVQDDNNPSRRR